MKKSSPGRQSAPKSGKGSFVPDLGDIVQFTFDPVAGTEQGGNRKGLVLTPHSYNAKVGRCFACPITGKARGYPFEVPLPEGLAVYGVVLTDQGRPLAFAERGARLICKAPQDVVDEVKAQYADFLQL